MRPVCASGILDFIPPSDSVTRIAKENTRKLLNDLPDSVDFKRSELKLKKFKLEPTINFLELLNKETESSGMISQETVDGLYDKKVYRFQKVFKNNYSVDLHFDVRGRLVEQEMMWLLITH